MSNSIPNVARTPTGRFNGIYNKERAEPDARMDDSANAADTMSPPLVRADDDFVRVLLVDEHAILRGAVGALIELETDLRVVGQAGSIRGAIDIARALQPDVIIAELSMPGTTGADGIVALRRQCPHARLVVLTVHATETYIRAALAAGADGYVLKDGTGEELIYAVRSVLRSQRYLCRSVSAHVVRSFLGEPDSCSPVVRRVTAREREILTMIANGSSNKRIAIELKRSAKTVEKHRANLMRKLQLHNVADVTRFAVNSGLLNGGDRK